jgi:hypothetical protein
LLLPRAGSHRRKVFDPTLLELVRPSAQTAITKASERMAAASTAKDIEGIVGASKELAETVAKAALDALGGTYGSDVDMPKLAKMVLTELGTHPAGFQGRTPLQRLSQGLVSVVHGLAELRNTDGTGHGRAVPSNLEIGHAEFARDAAVLWCRWVLSACRRVLLERVPLPDVVTEISTNIFHRGELPSYLEERRLGELRAEDQRKLGLAVARRWNVGGTFLALEDVIEPLASGKAEYPLAFAEGVVEGLLLDNDGFLKTSDRNVESAVMIALRLPPERARSVFDELAESAGDALLSPNVGDEALDGAVGRAETMAGDLRESPIGDALGRIARQLRGFRERRVAEREDWEDEVDGSE